MNTLNTYGKVRNQLGDELFEDIFIFNGKYQTLHGCVKNVWYNYYSKRDASGELYGIETRNNIVQAIISFYVLGDDEELSANTYELLNRETFKHPEGYGYEKRVSLHEILTDFLLHPALTDDEDESDNVTVSAERRKDHVYKTHVVEITTDFTGADRSTDESKRALDEAFLYKKEPYIFPTTFDVLFEQFDEELVREDYLKLLEEVKEQPTRFAKELVAKQYGNGKLEDTRLITNIARRIIRLEAEQLHTCDNCGQQFHQKRSGQRYCGYFADGSVTGSCYEQAKRKRERRQMTENKKTTNTNTKETVKETIELVHIKELGEIEKIVFPENVVHQQQLVTCDLTNNSGETKTVKFHARGLGEIETLTNAIASIVRKNEVGHILTIKTDNETMARLLNEKSGRGVAFNVLFSELWRKECYEIEADHVAEEED